MKWLLFLLSVYIMVLSCIPCSADDGCCMEETGITCMAEGNEHRGDEHEEKMPCSPFFACGVYHGVTLPATTVITVPSGFAVPVQHLSFYQEPASIAFLSSIWQPPKTA